MYHFISVIIPCRNEEKFISKCLDSIVSQDFPQDKLEILVIDGMSEDRTKEIIKDYSQKHEFIKLLENKEKFTPFGLNIGIKNAKGDIIIRMDSHAKYERDYIAKCSQYLEKYKVDNVGGVMKTIPAKNTTTAKSIAICLSHFFGAGGSRFRIGLKEPKLVDTLFGGCYRKETFVKIGLFNENLIRSQDIEFNLRLKKGGGKILLVPDIVSYYYPTFNLKDFLIHNIKDGIWAIYPLKFVKIPLRLRHYIPLIFVLSLLIFPWSLYIIALYLLVSLYFSVGIAIKNKDVRFLFLMPIVFTLRHIGYGLGSLLGIFKLIWKKENKKK